MRRAVLTVLVLAAAVGCSSAPRPVAAAVPATTTVAPDPTERYLDELERRGVDSTLTDEQLVQIGGAVCVFIPMTDRRTVIDSIGAQSTGGDGEAAQAVVDSAQTQLCPDADYGAAPASVPAAVPTPVPAPVPAPAPAPAPQVSASVANAIGSARSYLGYAGFSREGLIEQLEYEGYTTGEATEAVDSLDVDFNAEAAESAQSYLDYSSFSRSGLVDQLEYEGYTSEQAEYGVSRTYG